MHHSTNHSTLSIHAEVTPSAVVELAGVTREYGAGDRKTVSLRDVSLRARRGEMLVILGPSGSGKTTLLTLMAGLLEPSAGTVTLFGRPVETYSPAELQALRAGRIGFVFQAFNLIDALTVAENIALVPYLAGVGRAASRRRARELLGTFRIDHLARKFPPTLSQGEKQRVAVARAISSDAELIIADEPTASLETEQGMQIIRLLRHCASELGKCVVVATHDLRIPADADRTLRLQDGALVSMNERSPLDPSGERKTRETCAARPAVILSPRRDEASSGTRKRPSATTAATPR